MIKQLFSAGMILLATSVMANDIKYTFIEGGLYLDSENEKERDAYSHTEYESSTALARVNGSIGFGSLFYLPASIESSATSYDFSYCEEYYDYCYDSEGSVLTVIAVAGAGLHFDIGQNASLYTEIGLMNRNTSYDYDNDDYDADEEDSDNGNQQVLGLRIQPADLIEFDLRFRRVDWSDYSESFYHKNFSAQFNITEHIGVAASVIVASDKLSKFDQKIWGAYFRYSFK